ncbi:MAG: hypothetical protein R2741_06715 [Methanolobus sp.]
MVDLTLDNAGSILNKNTFSRLRDEYLAKITEKWVFRSNLN